MIETEGGAELQLADEVTLDEAPFQARGTVFSSDIIVT